VSKLWIGLLAGAGGFALGLVVAKIYAKQKVQGSVDSLLGSVGLGGGAIQGFADQYIVPAAVN
jgi:hypothetical protein